MRVQLITTPFHPGYLTAERIKKAPNLKLALTAGIGSDHIDLQAASKAGITVAEITGKSLFAINAKWLYHLCCCHVPDGLHYLQATLQWDSSRGMQLVLSELNTELHSDPEPVPAAVVCQA